MKDGKPIKVVDLYNVIMKECDGRAEKCNIFEDQPNVVSEAGSRRCQIMYSVPNTVYKTTADTLNSLGIFLNVLKATTNLLRQSTG